ncbi:efflux transporter outer membrane subunit [Allopontixanthobacter sediminis]|uniref:Efflux transporter outer membrane subunit n=1 Tax=Allopontixanthobacter sediminis TaxID=1689985 RepID=A0A845B9D2_9SPHN|nr:TolC family protein [Allopontixanthobacter sediminis]MXP44199.1 efflux transporter outer membrane subunit [Allopontixanthobacter sediminis]
MRGLRFASASAGVTAVLLLGGCVAGPPANIDTPPPALPGSFYNAPSADVSANVAALLPQDDPAFASLAAVMLDNSPTLAEAIARIERARAASDRAGANRLPLVGGSASVEATRTNPAQFGTNFPSTVSIDTERVSYGASLTASWDPDLFGRLRAQERAAIARIDAAGADAAGVRLALLAEVAGAVVDWRTLAAREAALEQDLVAAETLVTLADIRERSGIAPGFDRVRAEAAAEASRSRIAALPAERARLLGQLVTLTAQPAAIVRSALDQPAPDVAAPAPPAAVPSDLLTGRPDVLAAAARLAASDADLYAVAAQRFPRLDLSAALGLLAFDIGGLFASDAITGSVGGSLLAPLLDFGRIEAEIDGAEADKRIAFQAYRGAVFTALGDAEAGYGLVDAADRALAIAERERASNERSARLAEVRYRAGLSDFLTVLDARRNADTSGERAATARGQARRARVILWQALGGDQASAAAATP